MSVPAVRSETEILGLHIERARQHGITSIERAGDRAWMYQMAMRGLAKARLNDRATAQPSDAAEWNDKWRLTPEQNVELREELRLVSRRAAMMENFEAFVSGCREGTIKSGLRDYQLEPFEATQAFVSAATRDILACDEPLLQSLTKGGYLEEPPSFGKTYFMAEIAKAVGTGKAPNEFDEYPIRTLVLTPRRKLVRQTIGAPSTTTKVERGFAAAAPDLHVTPYYSSKQDLSGDVVVMTYQSFINAVRTGKLNEHHFDLILCDEGHRILAPKTLEALNQYRAGRLTIGLSGSPDYDEAKRLEDILPYRIDGSDPLTGIQEGYINGFQYWAYRTKSKIKVKNNSQAEFTDAELYPLINDKERNRLILSIMKRDIESGRHGIVRCVRGGDCLHPRIIASLAGNTLIRDPVTGEMRPMRVTALDYRQDDILDDIIDMLSQPDGPDALAYVGILNEGVDSDAIRFIVDAAPTASQVVGKQVVGRSYRLDPEGRLTMLSQLFDELEGRKARYTFLHAVGVEDFEQGLVVAPQSHVEVAKGSHRESTHASVISADDLPTELSDVLIEDLNTFCAEELVLRPTYGKLEDGSIALNALVELGRRYVPTLGKATIRHMMRRTGFEEPVYVKPEGGMPGHYYKEGAWEKLEEELAKIKMPPEGWRNRTTIIMELGSSTHRFDKFIKEKNLTGELFNHPQNLAEISYYSPDVFIRFQKHEGARKTPEPGDIEVLKLAREVGTTPAILERFLTQRDIQWEEMATPNGHPARFLTEEKANEVRGYFGIIEGSLTITEIGNLLGIARSRVLTWMNTKGYIEANKQEIQQKGESPKLNNFGRKFPPDIIAEAIDSLTPDEVDPDWVTLREYAAARGHSYTQAKRLAEGGGVTLQRALGAKTRGVLPVLYLDTEGRARFDEVAPEIPKVAPGDRTMNQLKEMTGFSDFKIRSRMTSDEIASGVQKIDASVENVGRRPPYFPAETVAALLGKFGLPIPADVARAAGLIPGSSKPTAQTAPAEIPKHTPTPAPTKQEPAPVPGERSYPRRPFSGPTLAEEAHKDEPWQPVGRFLEEIGCDTKSFWVLLRRCNLAAKSSFRRLDGSREVQLKPYAAAQIRRLAAFIEVAPKSWYSSAEIALHCRVGEQKILDFVRAMTPQEQEIKLFRSADTGAIITHYSPRIASAAKQRFPTD